MGSDSPLAAQVLLVAFVLFGIIVFLQPFVVGVIASRKGRDGLLWGFVVAVMWWTAGVGLFVLYVPFALMIGEKAVAVFFAVYALLPTFLIMIAPAMGEPRPISMKGLKRFRLRRRKRIPKAASFRDEDTDIVWRSIDERQ